MAICLSDHSVLPLGSLLYFLPLLVLLPEVKGSGHSIGAERRISTSGLTGGLDRAVD